MIYDFGFSSTFDADFFRSAGMNNLISCSSTKVISNRRSWAYSANMS